MRPLYFTHLELDGRSQTSEGGKAILAIVPVGRRYEMELVDVMVYIVWTIGNRLIRSSIVCIA